MQRNCPSCSEPITVDETLLDVGSTNSVVRCSNCGVLVPTGIAGVKDSGDAATVIHTPAHQAGQTIAHFRLERILGQGSFGAVWLAEDMRLSRRVAIKLPRISDKDGQLLREARTAAKLKHPNIVSVFEVGENDGQVFIAGEFIDGEDLREEMRRGRPETSRSVELIRTLARAAHHAHEHGIVHRDLKPGNVILNQQGHPFIADFGIAKELTADESVSLFGQIIGTIAYMSPEQASGSTSTTDRRSDIYALGVMLFELLTDNRPFRGSADGILYQKNHQEAPSPRTLVPTLPRDLETICLKCLQKSPARRYQSAEELADELHRFQNNIPILARPVSWMEKTAQWRRRQPLAAGLLLAVFVSLILGLLSSIYFWRSAQDFAEVTADALYRSDMCLAGELWNKGDVIGLQRTMDRYLTGTEARKRDFCWNFFRTAQQPIVQIANHGSDIFDVAVSPDGKMFGSVGRDRVIRLWSAENGSLIRTLGPFQEKITAICFSPVDERLASAHEDGQVRLWNPFQHDHVAAEFALGMPATTVRFSPDGRLLASGGDSGIVRIWSVKNREMTAELGSSDRKVLALRFSPDGNRIAIGRAPGLVRIHNVPPTESAVDLPIVSRLTSMVFANDGSSLVVATSSGTSSEYSIESGELTGRFDAAEAGIGDIECLPVIDQIARVDTSGRLILLDRQHTIVRSIPTHTLSFGMMDVSGDGTTMVVGSGDGLVKLIDVESLKRRDVFWQPSAARSVTFSSDGQQVAMAFANGELKLWDIATGDIQSALGSPTTGPVRSLLSVTARANTGEILACGMMREIFRVDSASATMIGETRLNTAAHSVARFSTDNQWLAVGSRSGSVQLFDPADLSAPRQEWSTADAEVTDLCFSADNSTLIVADSGSKVSFIHCESGEVLDVFSDLSAVPLTIALCDSGRVLAIGTQAGDIVLHRIDRSQPQLVVRAHAGRVNDIAVFPNDRRLVSGGRDSALCIWDVSTGERVTTLYGHRRQIFCVAVSPDGSTVVSGGLQGDVRVWRSE